MASKNLIQSFLNYLSLEKNYSSHTISAYRKDLEDFSFFLKQNFDLSRLEDVHYNNVRSWIVDLVDQNISNRSINRKMSSLKSFYKFLQKTETIKTNPLSKHKALKVEKKVQVPFSPSEVNEVIDTLELGDDFESIRDKLIIEILYSTGIRKSELIHIKESDINRQEGIIKVVGKRNKERHLPILSSIQDSISTYLSKKNEIGLANEYLFVTQKDSKLYETLVYRIVNSYFSRVSSKAKKSPHILRHTFATQLLNEGADLNSVKELLGHSSLASTQVYTHNSLDQIKRVYNQAHPRSSKKTDL